MSEGLLAEEAPVSTPNPFLVFFRGDPFNIKKLLGGSLDIAEEDERSLELDGLELGDISFVSLVRPGEKCVRGELLLERLKAERCVRLDAKVFQILWESKHLIPQHFREKIRGCTRYNLFPGTVFVDRFGGRHIIALYWIGNKWKWELFQLWHERAENFVFAVTHTSS